jgi:DNA-binding transcriptional ArsR family regulator
VTKLCAGRNVPLPENLHVTIRAGYRLDDEEALAPLIAWFQDYRPDLIVWDVFNRLHLKDERKPDQIMPVLWRLDQLRNEVGCANLLAHHSRKPGPTGPDLASGGQRLRGPSEFWGWAENSLYLSPLKGKGNIVIEPESKDAIVEPFKAHLEDVGPEARRWIYDGTLQAKVEKGNETRAKILALISSSPQTVGQLATAAKLSEKTIAKHLGALEAEGLAEFVKEPGRTGRRVWMAVSVVDAATYEVVA